MAALQSVFTRGSAALGAILPRVEVWSTPCVVAHPPGGWCDVLVVPANETLVGTALPYFPVGGPVPKPMPPGLANAAWGGMGAGDGMLYASQVVDGAVSLHGGRALRALCQALPVLNAHTGARCPVGRAVIIPAAGALGKSFVTLVHTVPPFRSAEAAWAPLLARCYCEALDLATAPPGLDTASGTSHRAAGHALPPFRSASNGDRAAGVRALGGEAEAEAGGGAGEGSAVAVAFPLLGAGARGAPASEAAAVGATAISAWAEAAEAAAEAAASATSSATSSAQARGAARRRPVVVRFGCTDRRVETFLEGAFLEQGWALALISEKNA